MSNIHKPTISNWTKMKLTVFSILTILVSTYAVMVDKEEKSYLHDVLQINNGLPFTKCLRKYCYERKFSNCAMFPVYPPNYFKIGHEYSPWTWLNRRLICRKTYRCPCPTPASTPSTTKCMKWCPVREV